MKNGLNKKGLVLGILILFIFISIMPNVTAYDNIVYSDVNENNTVSTSSQPDVIISGFKIDKLIDHSGEWYYRLYASIKNIGDVAVSSRFKVSIQAYKIRFFVPDDIVESYSGDTMGNENIAPGGFASVHLESSYSSFFFTGFLTRIEHYLTCYIGEENEDNNNFERNYIELPGLLNHYMIPISFRTPITTS